MLSAIVSRLVILIFGTLYPAYASYKAVRSKDVKEYVKWMMYWIVFALFTSAETFTDVFLGFWFPFYYEVKVILVFWLLSPMTKGSSFLYRKFVHPMLSRREHDIDEYIARAKDQGYSTVVSLGTKGVNYATAVIMQTAIKNLGLPASFAVAPIEAPAPRAVRAVRVDETDFQFPDYEEPGLAAYSDEESVEKQRAPSRKRAPLPRRSTRQQTATQISDDEDSSLK